jgi:ornithine carbamoyltransferase
MKHLLSIESLSAPDIAQILSLSARIKKSRGARNAPRPLQGQTWALIFSKASTRTRVSFEVGIRELGGHAIFLNANDIQLGRGESVEDTARVLCRYVHGIVMRTYGQKDVETVARVGTIPVINALTDDEHPCQILSDVFTIEEKLGSIAGKKIVFLGDGGCNVARSWIFAAARLGFELRIAAPKRFQPPDEVLSRAAKLAVKGGKIIRVENVLSAAQNADVLYTDVWVSMGKEAESQQRIKSLAPYQLNKAVVKAARRGALVMHCLPAYRDQEISSEVFERHADTIFDQAENRLHVQKAIIWLVASSAN